MYIILVKVLNHYSMVTDLSTKQIYIFVFYSSCTVQDIICND